MGWLNNFITSHIDKSYTENVIKDAQATFEKPEVSQKAVIEKAIQASLDAIHAIKTSLEGRIETITSNLESMKQSFKSELKAEVSKLDSKFTNRINTLEKELKDNAVVHIIKSPKETNEVEGIVHEMFDTVLTMVNNDIPVFLSGPAGCGKNHLCKQVAEALGMNFYFTNAVTQEYRLTGFIDANGKYHETEFYKAAVNGGLFMLDEIDGSIPEVLILLNAAIANRYFDFPTGRIELHPNFRIIAAGNTVGTGGDSLYTGRTRLDAASLDRFCLVQMNYSKAIERAITNNNKELISFVRVLRETSSLIVSYRALIAITLLESEMELTKVLKMSLIKGISADNVRTIQGRLPSISNKYIEAFMRL